MANFADDILDAFNDIEENENGPEPVIIKSENNSEELVKSNESCEQMRLSVTLLLNFLGF